MPTKSDTPKKPRTSKATRAFAHWEAALALLQQIHAELTPEEVARIDRDFCKRFNPEAMPQHWPAARALYGAHDVFCSVKHVLDPEGVPPKL